MEIRCSDCGHVGVAEVTQDDQGLALICASCGHKNRLDLGAFAPPAEVSQSPIEPAEEVAQPEQPKGPTEFELEALQRLLPIPGEGPRCPKCAHLLGLADEFCGRCGLSIAEQDRFETGEAPWERPPEGKEDAYDQAELLWSSLEENWNDENFEKFASFVRDEGLTELAARRLRFRLVDHPDDALSLAFLGEVASHLQTHVLIAGAQARASAQQFSEVTQRAKTVLVYLTFVLWMIILAIVVTVVRQ